MVPVTAEMPPRLNITSAHAPSAMKTICHQDAARFMFCLCSADVMLSAALAGSPTCAFISIFGPPAANGTEVSSLQYINGFIGADFEFLPLLLEIGRANV